MNALKLCIRFSLCLFFALLNATRSGAGESKSWSADLSRYGLATTRVEGRSHSYQPKISVASTHGVVAVAFGMPRIASLRGGGEPWNVPGDISLLLFDAAHGKLLAKAGPWAGDFLFEIFGTPQGNFLLHVRQHHDVNKKYEDAFYLLSSAGRELKELRVAPIPQNAQGSSLLLAHSPSGGTLLLIEYGEDGVHYKLLDTDALESRFEWIEPRGSSGPYAEAISDQEILGGRDNDKRTQIPFIREFDTAWRELPSSSPMTRPEFDGNLFRSHLLFLSNELLLGWERGSQGSDATLRLVRTDGATVSSPILPQPSHGVSFPKSLVVSQDGRYFAFTGTRENYGSHVMLDVLKMDMTFWPDEMFLIVWDASRPQPLAKFDLGKLYTPFSVQGLCFAGDDPPGIVFVDGATLRFVSMQVAHNSESKP